MSKTYFDMDPNSHKRIPDRMKDSDKPMWLGSMLQLGILRNAARCPSCGHSFDLPAEHTTASFVRCSHCPEESNG